MQSPADPTASSFNAGARNLVLVRAGDESLHPTWLAEQGAPRNWRLHISYFGKAGRPACADVEGVTWTHDPSPSKWLGLDECLSKKPFNVDDFDFIATPDDDLLVPTSTWNRTFEMVRKYNLAIAQHSLHNDSFYTINLALQRKGLEIRFINCVEYMSPIFRVDMFREATKYFNDPQSIWGIEYVLADMVAHDPRSMAVLDAAPVLHTRAHGVSPMYAHMLSDGLSMYEMEAAFLKRVGSARIHRRTLSAIDLQGREVGFLDYYRKPILWSYALRAGRKLRSKQRILSIRDPQPQLAAKLGEVTRASGR